MNTLLVKPALSFSFADLYIGHDLLKETLLKDLCEKWKVKALIIADQAVKDLHADPLAKALQADLLVVPGGEQSKNQETKDLIEKKLFHGGYGRDTLIIAMGGGATTDLVGFIASTYLRGVPLVLIPTTLLSMVDAAIGGKTAINTSFGKNLLGTFYHPKAILIDTQTLSSLPEIEWLNGLSEMLKMGLISDPLLWNLIKDNLKNKTAIFKDLSLITRSVEGKARVVEKDPLDTGFRRILNFGHTIGHGIEALSCYEMPHGQAVALGCVVEAHLSMTLGYLSTDEFEEIYNLYSFYSLRLPQTYTRKSLLQTLSHDKKREQKKLRFVLIDSIGHAISFEGNYCRHVSENELEATLNWMELSYG